MNIFRHATVAAALASAARIQAVEPAAAIAPAPAADAVSSAAGASQDILEHLVDVVLELFGLSNSGNTPTHFIVAGLFLVCAFFLRRVVTTVLFGILRRWSAKTETTLDDKLFASIKDPVAALISVGGAVAALKVLKLSAAIERTVGYAVTIALSLALFWLLLRAFNALLDHAQEVADKKRLGIAAFMPWIRKTLVVVFVVFGILLIAQSLGADVKAFLAGLGIGGLAFALAAQDTIANIFGSVVVAIDQPFIQGDYVRIGAHEGTVEEIGLRSTRLRTPSRTLITLPNKMVAGEAINNFSRMPQRRVEQKLGLTYDTTPEQMETVVSAIRGLLEKDTGVSNDFLVVQFAGFGESSLDIEIVYFTTDPDYRNHMQLRQRINLGILRLVEAQGLSFAFPTQTVHQASPRRGA